MKLDPVVIVQNSLKTVVSFRLGYIKKIIASGGTVKVIAPNDCFESRSKLLRHGVDVINIPYHKGWMLGFTFFMMNLAIAKQRIFYKNVYICHFVSSFVICYFTLVPFNRRLCIYTEGLGSFFGKRLFFRKALRFLMLSSSGVRLFCNEYETQTIGRPQDTVTGGIGIDISEFNIYRKSQGSNIKNILFVGRLIKDKGIDTALRIHEELILDSNVTLHLVGDIYPGNPSSLTLEDIENVKKKFAGTIIFHGYQNNLKTFYSSADVLILPSILEGFPVCVMEASMAGLPSVCFDVPGCKDSITDGINGFLSKPFDFYDYLSKVKKALSKSDQLSQSCKTYAMNNFDRNKKDLELICILSKL